MSNAKEIKERINSIKETRKITNAMYLISSAKVRQAKEKLANTEPFFFAMQNEIKKILFYWPDISNVFFDTRKNKDVAERKIGIIVVTSDKGLAGSYNHNVIRATENLINKPGEKILFVLGEVGRHYFSKYEGQIHIDKSFNYTVQDPNLFRSRRISEKVTDMFISGELDEVHIIYTSMVNALSQYTDHLKLLPLHKTTFTPDDSSTNTISDHRSMHEDYKDLSYAHSKNLTFYPSPDEVITNIVPSYINGIIYGCLVESYCSEHNARMISMQNSTDSADKMLSELNMTYNRVRQSDITQELTEIVAGAQAQQRK